MLPATVGRLAYHGGIVGLKEARSDAERISAVVALQNPQFSILSGDDATCMGAMLAGADGVISVAANVVPEVFRALCDASRARDAETARRVDGSLAALYELLGVEPNPIPLKWCLHRLGFGEPDLRAPLLALSPEHRERADRVVASLPGMIQVRHSDAA
jgi:4-hydroxy-tetrahydrodipicolinate synthase